MPAELIDGALMARAVRDEVASEVAQLTALGHRPGLAVVLVGDDPASAVYVRSKGRACEEAGMYGVTIRLPAETTEDALLAQVDALNADERVHGILVQMPLPRHIDAVRVLYRIRPDKDVDGFHPVNAGKLSIGASDGFVPCTPGGILELLRRYAVPTRGAECVVIGRSNIVGKPMALLMLNESGGNATVTVCHSRTADMAAHTRRADILIAAVGRPNLVTAAMVKPGAVVIDVGMNRVPDPTAPKGSRLVGDVDFPAVREVAALMTPVPGGVGPMTIAMLIRNTVIAARRRHTAAAAVPTGV